jgi:hypothetical protein
VNFPDYLSYSLSLLESRFLKIVAMCAYVLLPLIVYFYRRRMPVTFTGIQREVFDDAQRDSWELLLLSVSIPSICLGISLITGNLSWVTKEALPAMCLVCGLQSTMNLYWTRKMMELNPLPSSYPQKKTKLEYLASESRGPGYRGIIALAYGVVTIILVNSPLEDHLTGWLWYVSFMVSGMALVCALRSKIIFTTMKRVYSWPTPTTASALVSANKRGKRKRRKGQRR